VHCIFHECLLTSISKRVSILPSSVQNLGIFIRLVSEPKSARDLRRSDWIMKSTLLLCRYEHVCIQCFSSRLLHIDFICMQIEMSLSTYERNFFFNFTIFERKNVCKTSDANCRKPHGASKKITGWITNALWARIDFFFQKMFELIFLKSNKFYVLWRKNQFFIVVRS
jgi:hypothetical protein